MAEQIMLDTDTPTMAQLMNPGDTAVFVMSYKVDHPWPFYWSEQDAEIKAADIRVYAGAYDAGFLEYGAGVLVYVNGEEVKRISDLETRSLFTIETSHTVKIVFTAAKEVVVYVDNYHVATEKVDSDSLTVMFDPDTRLVSYYDADTSQTITMDPDNLPSLGGSSIWKYASLVLFGTITGIYIMVRYSGGESS